MARKMRDLYTSNGVEYDISPLPEIKEWADVLQLSARDATRYYDTKKFDEDKVMLSMLAVAVMNARWNTIEIRSDQDPRRYIQVGSQILAQLSYMETLPDIATTVHTMESGEQLAVFYNLVQFE